MLFCTEIFTYPAIFIFVLGSFYYVYTRFFSAGPLPDVLPWVGVNEDHGGPWSRARATLKSFGHTRELLQEGYFKVKHTDLHTHFSIATLIQMLSIRKEGSLSSFQTSSPDLKSSYL